MFSKTNKPKVNPWADDHPEKLSDSPKQTVGKQLAGLVSPSKMLDQIFGVNKSESHYRQPKETVRPRRENTIFSFTDRREQVAIQKETHEILQQIKNQITLLEKSEKALTKEVSKFKLEQVPARSGIYYLRYFEWLLSLIKQLRMKVEEGRTWLQVFSQRKKKKLGYWKMYKKHGTTFGLSHERSLATQTG